MIDRDTPEYEEAKYRVKISHFLEQGFDLDGVVHVGTYDGYETQWYLQLGLPTIGFEPLPYANAEYNETYAGRSTSHQLALSNVDGKAEFLDIHDGSSGQSSSLLEPTPELDSKNTLTTTRIQVKTARFDTWVRETNTDISDYDTIVIDVQGHELEVLQGFGDLISQFKYLSVECSDEPIYQGGATGQMVADYLEAKGFTLDSPIYSHNDVFFVRSDIKPNSERVYLGRA